MKEIILNGFMMQLFVGLWKSKLLKILILISLFQFCFSFDSQFLDGVEFDKEFDERNGGFMNVTINSASVNLTWDGVDVCSHTSSCLEEGMISVSAFACSSGIGNWNNGEAGFTDPIPPGNVLIGVNVTFYGQFACDIDGGDATFLASIDDMILSWNKLPNNSISGCNCTNNCATSASFESTKQYNALSGYNYGGANIFQVQMIVNDICLSLVQLTMFYQPIDIKLFGIAPNSGSMNEETLVNITGSGFNQTNTANWVCRFGNVTNYKPAIAINNNTLQCYAPPAFDTGNVTVQVSSDGGNFFSSSDITFTYYDDLVNIIIMPTKPTVLSYIIKYWWLIMTGCLLILVLIVALILTLRKRKMNKNKEKDRENNVSINANSPSAYDSLSFSGTIREDIDIRELKIAQRIGRGNFGEVFVANWRGTNVAVKKTKFPTVSSEEEREEFLADFEREASIMRSLRHPNVLQFLGICSMGEEICIITEYMPKGSLFRILHDKRVPLDWNLKIRIACDVSRGMSYLHKCDPIIIHRDLKSHNLLVDESFKVKVSDFGLAKLLTAHESHSSMTSCGTPAFTAPEVLRNERYSEKADVFSFAVVLWELVTREEPYHGTPPFQIVFSVGTQGMRLTIPSSCPTELAILIEECWSENPKNRPHFEEINLRLEKISKLVKALLMSSEVDV